VHWDPATGVYIKSTVEHGLVGNWVNALALAPEGTLWVGTEGGLSRRSPDGSWTPFTTQGGLADDSVKALALAPMVPSG
jgi:ligand-binding sensor domain-containing protein